MAKTTSSAATSSGIGIGSVIAMLLTWQNGQDILWTVIHGVFGWGYVIFYMFGGR